MFNFLSRILYPYHCLDCQKELSNSYFCDACFDKIPLLKEQVCPVCEKPSPYGNSHHECKKETPLNGVFVAMDYKEKIVKKLIQQYKYKLVKSLEDTLNAVLIKALKTHSAFPYLPYIPDPPNSPDQPPAVITSVPLHPLKLRFRGFNQSEILAENLSRQFGADHKKLLVRVKNNPQKDVKKLSDRQQNIKNSFRVNPRLDLRLSASKKIIIVDDVTTTLSTLNECAKTLSVLGPKKIYGIVLARGK